MAEAVADAHHPALHLHVEEAARVYSDGSHAHDQPRQAGPGVETDIQRDARVIGVDVHRAGEHGDVHHRRIGDGDAGEGRGVGELDPTKLRLAQVELGRHTAAGFVADAGQRQRGLAVDDLDALRGVAAGAGALLDGHPGPERLEAEADIGRSRRGRVRLIAAEHHRPFRLAERDRLRRELVDVDVGHLPGAIGRGPGVVLRPHVAAEALAGIQRSTAASPFPKGQDEVIHIAPGAPQLHVLPDRAVVAAEAVEIAGGGIGVVVGLPLVVEEILEARDPHGVDVRASRRSDPCHVHIQRPVTGGRFCPPAVAFSRHFPGQGEPLVLYARFRL